MYKTHLSLYKEYLLLEKKMSKNSVAAYLRDIEKFVEFSKKNSYSGEISLITSGDIEQFLAYLYDLNLSKSSMKRVVSGVKSFFKFLVISDVIESSPCRLISAPKSERLLPETLSVEEVLRMLDGVDLSVKQGHRNRAILELMYSSGLRVSEICDLRVRDIMFEDQLIRVTGKGDKTRIVPVGDVALRMIRLYLNGGESHINGAIFTNSKGEAISRVQIFNIVKRAAKDAGVEKNVSPHTLRHCFASHLLANGANLRVIQALLGHESISTTEIYTHLEIKQMQEAVNLLPVKPNHK